MIRCPLVRRVLYCLLVNMEDWQKYLESIYHDPSHPGSFTGPETLYKVVLAEGKFKIGRHRIRKWLQDQESYSLTRGARRKYNRSRVIVNGKVGILGRQLYPGRGKAFMKAYEDAVGSKEGYLIVDTSPHGDDRCRLKSRVFPGQDPLVYRLL